MELHLRACGAALAQDSKDCFCQNGLAVPRLCRTKFSVWTCPISDQRHRQLPMVRTAAVRCRFHTVGLRPSHSVLWKGSQIDVFYSPGHDADFHFLFLMRHLLYPIWDCDAVLDHQNANIDLFLIGTILSKYCRTAAVYFAPFGYQLHYSKLFLSKHYCLVGTSKYTRTWPQAVMTITLVYFTSPITISRPQYGTAMIRCFLRKRPTPTNICAAPSG